MAENHVLTVESKSCGYQTCIGMEMNEKKAVTLVVFDERDGMQKRQLKEMIIAMTQKGPRERIDMNEVCRRINRK